MAAAPAGRGAATRAALIWALAALGGLVAARARADEATAATPPAAIGASVPAGHGATPKRPASPLDKRVELLTAELGLDAGQQAKVRQILASQREQVRRLWSDQAVAPAARIGATQAISDRTAGEIRAILSDEQRKKYIAAKVPRVEGDRPEHGMDYWMDPARGPPSSRAP